VVYEATLPAAMFEGNATQKTSAATVYIPAGACMEEGSGTAPAVDTDPDDDGVHGALDKFPDDPTRAYIFESENFAGGGSTVAFEDSWPLKGDYDLNDVVINYKYQFITNSENKIVDVKATYVLIATGGSFQNGAGIEFPVAANKVTITSSSITPTPAASEISLESGQDKAVLILFNNSRAQQLTWNTQAGVASSPTVKFEVTLHFTNGPLQSDFGTGPFNPFIWNSGLGRTYETHLYGKTPTTKAATSNLFGTGDDRTNGTRYYGTENNLPWGIMVPTAIFKYPVERAPITDGYKKFDAWAISGGTSNQDWYEGTGAAYRDDTQLY
jgi:LruC domain-containing protein